jgi:hypothetical protein
MITVIDWGIWILYFLVIFSILWFYRHSKTNNGLYQWFLKAFLVKVFGGVIFSLVSIYYYGGDTFLYFQGAKTMSTILHEDPAMFLKLMSTPHDLSNQFSEISQQISYSRTKEEWFMVKILSIFSFISFNSYLVLTLFMNTIAFWGGWKLFKVFSDILPNVKNHIFWIVFLAPSIFFWGNGILKDTITLALINYIIYISYQILEKKRFNLFYLGFSLLATVVIYNLKSYIILAFLPSFFFILYLYLKSKIKSPLIRFFSGPIILISLIFMGFFGLENLSQSTNYSTDNIQQHITGFHTWHTTTGGSSYNLGEIEYTPIGIISKIPAALNATFFRPYIWTARNPIMLVGALESTIVLILFIAILISTKFRLIRYLNRSKFLLGLSIFVLVFGFAVGFTSYNFGALARYKMPIYSIFIFTLYYIYTNKKNNNIS